MFLLIFLFGRIIASHYAEKEEPIKVKVFKIEVSSQSHPFYTGKNVLLDTAGRVDKFYKRFGGKKEVAEQFSFVTILIESLLKKSGRLFCCNFVEIYYRLRNELYPL